jgi:hypothetical protein
LSLGAASRHRQPRLLTLDLEAEGLRWRFLRTLCRAASLPGLPLSRQVARMPNAINRLREEIRLAEQGCNHWQNLVIELQEEADALFSMTAPETRKKVFKCCWSMVQRYLFAFPLNNAKALLEFAETGALNIRSGKPAAITTTADGWSVAWENEAGMDNRSRFDAIICATGFHLPRFHASSGALQFVTDPAHTHPTPPHVTADLRVQLPHAAAAENIWLIGIPSYLRSGLISIAYLGVLQADKVARLCSQPLHAPVAPNLPATAHTT